MVTPDDTGSEAAADPTQPASDEFLAANRENRAKAREQAQAKAAKAQAKQAKRDKRGAADDVASTDGDDDRVPRKLAPEPGATAAAGSPTGWLARRRLVVGLLVGLVVAVIVLAAVAGILGYRYADARDQLDQASPSSEFGQEAMDTARKYAAVIGTYDPDNYGDLDQRIRSISTPAFADSYITSSQDARKGNANARGESKAESKEAGLESLSPTKAVVLVTLDQVVNVPELRSSEPDGIQYQSRVKITLKRDGNRWLITDLETV